MEFFWENIVGIIGLLVGSFIAYHVYFLSKKLSEKERLEHKEKIKQKAEDLLSEIHRKELRRKVYLVNIKRFFKDYPSNEEKRFEGYSHIMAEIKSVRFDGIEFFSSMPVSIYKKPNGSLSFKGELGEKAFNAFPVSIVPYEWLEYVDLEGDEYAYVPLFYCHFKGKNDWRSWLKLRFYGDPYSRTVYYKESDVYDMRRDPYDMKWDLIYQPISKY